MLGSFVVVKLSLIIIKHIKITRKRQSCIKRHTHTCMVHCSSMVHNYVHADAAVMNYAYGLVVLDMIRYTSEQSSLLEGCSLHSAALPLQRESYGVR